MSQGFDFDFNNADHSEDRFALIPDGTIVPVVISIQPGGAGPGGLLTKAKDTPTLMLRLECTVTQGPFYKKKFWDQYVVQQEGEGKAVAISKSNLRGLVESARGIVPTDESEQAKAGRRLSGWADLQGLRPTVKVRIEKNDQYGDRNRVSSAVPVNHPSYIQQAPEQGSLPGWDTPPRSGVGGSAPNSGTTSRPTNW